MARLNDRLTLARTINEEARQTQPGRLGALLPEQDRADIDAAALPAFVPLAGFTKEPLSS